MTPDQIKKYLRESAISFRRADCDYDAHMVELALARIEQLEAALQRASVPPHLCEPEQNDG